MIRRKVKCTDGTEITELIPETEEDLKELQRLQDEGKLDSDHSFSDDPDRWRAIGIDPRDVDKL